MTITIGSLFSGYGGLDMAVDMALGPTRTAWVSDIEPGPCAILKARFPDAPNLGDITAIDWAEVEPVDIICGGSPCQDLSSAGQRAGMRPGTRSGLWESMAHAIDKLRPSLVVWENVRGALSAPAFSLMESETGHLGDGSGGPVLRALGRVLGDLTNLGYDAQWATVRASDVGAPHQRARLFVVAYPNGDLLGEYARRALTQEAGTHEDHRPANISGGSGAVTLLPTPTSSDHTGVGHAAQGGLNLRTTVQLLPPPTATVRDRTPNQVAARFGPNGSRTTNGPNLDDAIHLTEAWGNYAPAVHRWEQILGRSAPEPTEPSETGKPQLSPAFVEWMMGLPRGWVTDIDISRAQQLRALGNGVVPQQGAAAITQLLERR